MELTIQGKKVKVDDAFTTLTREEMDAVVDDIAADMKSRGMFDPTPTDFAVQGGSGVVEGMVNLADFAMTLLSAGTMRGQGENIKQLLRDVGAIAPESENDALETTRRVGESVGASLIPGASLASQAARPLAVGAMELGSAVAGGLGGSVAQKALPGNVAAEIGAEFLGGMTPSGAVNAVRRMGQKAGPAIDALEVAKDAAYKAVDDAGVTYSGSGYKRLVDGIVNEALDSYISPTRHEASFDFITDIEKRHPKGLTLSDLDLIRQEAKRDLLGSSNRSDKRFGQIVVDQIDDFIANAKGDDIAFGSGAQGQAAIETARQAHRRLRATELVDEAIENANLTTASTGSGGNINNALRQQLRRLITDKKKRISFTDDELAELKQVVEQDSMEGLLRWVGKAAPGGNGLALLTHLAGTAINPAWAVVPVAGTLAKGAADAGTINRANALRGNIASGGVLRLPPRDNVGPSLSGARAGATLADYATENQSLRNRIQDERKRLRLNALN